MESDGWFSRHELDHTGIIIICKITTPTYIFNAFSQIVGFIWHSRFMEDFLSYLLPFCFFNLDLDIPKCTNLNLKSSWIDSILKNTYIWRKLWISSEKCIIYWQFLQYLLQFWGFLTINLDLDHPECPNFDVKPC